MIGYQATRVFFDTKAVMARLPPARRKALSKGGAFIRQTARGSIRKGKKPSKPGSPPKSHVGTLKRLLYFAFDLATDSTVIGPEFTNTPGRRVKPVNGTVASTLEEGGAVSVFLKRTGQSVNAKIEARPFMAPALEKNKSKLPELWRDSIT